MPTEFKNVYLTEALESIQAEKRVSIQEMDNHTEVLEATLRTKTDNLKEELEAIVSLAMKVPILKNINAMKVADGLLDGDVVELQGYYEAGDGAAHKRKIALTEELELLHSWTSLEAYKAYYTVDTERRFITLNGLITGDEVGVNICQIPSKYAPKQKMLFLTHSDTDTNPATIVPACISVDVQGVVNLRAGGTTIVSLDGISYYY